MLNSKSIVIVLFFISTNLNAHHKVYSPRVEEGRLSLEWRGHLDIDDQDSIDSAHHHVLETENSWTDFWQTELEFHISDKSDTTIDLSKIEFQNQFEIFSYTNFAGALYFSYNFVSEGIKGDQIEYKYLNEVNNNYFALISNIIFEKEVGSPSQGSTELSFSNYFLFKKPIFKDVNFSLIGFSELGEVSNIKTYHNQEHQYGFQFETEFEINQVGYEFALGFLQGLTNQTSNQTLIWNFELEF